MDAGALVSSKKMAFRVTRVALQYAKKSTGIVGLPVEPNARQVLVQLYTRILESLKVRWCNTFSVCPLLEQPQRWSGSRVHDTGPSVSRQPSARYCLRTPQHALTATYTHFAHAI